MNKQRDVWSCPDCPWEQSAHPTYGWLPHHERAVEVHREMLCPMRPGLEDSVRCGCVAYEHHHHVMHGHTNTTPCVCKEPLSLAVPATPHPVVPQGRVDVPFCVDLREGRECSHREEGWFSGKVSTRAGMML